jgi:hypothetical protein
MNKKYLILGALLLVGGYIAYKKFYVGKDDESETDLEQGKSDTSSSSTTSTSTSSPTESVPTSTDIITIAKPDLKVMNLTSDNAGVYAQSSQTSPAGASKDYVTTSFAGLGGY